MSSENLNQIGLIGLGVMGRNYCQNLGRQGYTIAGLDSDPRVCVGARTQFIGQGNIEVFEDQEEWLASIEVPRKVFVFVPAGNAVDAIIEELLDHLKPGDILVDAGNSHYSDTERRIKALLGKKVLFMGMGVSGGSEGALNGPSMMPGGPQATWEVLRPVLESTAARFKGEPCVSYIGGGGSGHYVKMVHNGIEYALMQLIAEVYSFLESSNNENTVIGKTFEEWNKGRLSSYLLSITPKILAHKEETGSFLLDSIEDAAGQKGTGKWTSMEGLALGVPIPGIDTAVGMRALSGYTQLRQQIEKNVKENNVGTEAIPLEDLEKALFLSYLISFAQGFHLLSVASEQYGFELDLAEIAGVWREGCIIRADLLSHIRNSYLSATSNGHLLASPEFRDQIRECAPALGRVAEASTRAGISMPVMSASLQYLMAFSQGKLPLNLVQAQRDYFGSHGYRRTDKPGLFSTDWREDKKI